MSQGSCTVALTLPVFFQGLVRLGRNSRLGYPANRIPNSFTMPPTSTGSLTAGDATVPTGPRRGVQLNSILLRFSS